MDLLDICLLAMALAMDCFTVSIVSGIISMNQTPVPMNQVRMALLFGFFQAFMPLLGWLGISYFCEWIENYDHWVAFLMLVFIGFNMIREAFGPEDEHAFDSTRLSVQLLLSVATSIDAFAVGISFACTGYHSLSQLALPLITIGVVSFLFSILGYWLGSRFGRTVVHRLKPELLGGAILIMIGIKILISHLYHL